MLSPIGESEKGTSKCILNKNAQLYCCVLQGYGTIQLYMMGKIGNKKIITNKFKCFVTFNACNKFPMLNMKTSILI